MKDPYMQGLRRVRGEARVREKAESTNRHVNGERNEEGGQERDGRIGLYCGIGVSSGGGGREVEDTETPFI